MVGPVCPAYSRACGSWWFEFPGHDLRRYEVHMDCGFKSVFHAIALTVPQSILLRADRVIE